MRGVSGFAQGSLLFGDISGVIVGSVRGTCRCISGGADVVVF